MWTELHKYAKIGDLDKVCMARLQQLTPEVKDFVVKKGYSFLEPSDMTGTTALHKAAQYGHVEIVRFFVTKAQDPADLNVQNKVRS